MADAHNALVELGEYIIHAAIQGEIPNFKFDQISDFNSIFTAINLGTKVLYSEISRTNAYSLGKIKDMEDVLAIANKRFVDALLHRRCVAGIATPFQDEIINVPNCEDKELVCLIHPLDGHKLLDLNVSVGTLFSIYRRTSPIHKPVILEDFLQVGENQICAGYVIYGTSTMLVLTLGNGVHGFTLDPSLGTFYLSHKNMQYPPMTSEKKDAIYSINSGKKHYFPRGIIEYTDYCQQKMFTLRYIGAIVADFHRNLLKGGIFIYPPTFTERKPSVSMVFQCFPLAFLSEQAGGKACDGFTRILELKPISLQDRVPFFCGCHEMVSLAEKCMARNKIYDGAWSYGPKELLNTYHDINSPLSPYS